MKELIPALNEALLYIPSDSPHRETLIRYINDGLDKKPERIIRLSDIAALQHKQIGFFEEQAKRGLCPYIRGVQMSSGRWSFDVYADVYFKLTGFTWDDVDRVRQERKQKQRKERV